jgi:2-oxoglutarate/2-oxoacid ferredoxin oxidoreductase subunit alpha
MTDRKLMKGNEALALAAIQAGCRYYFGYPITPQNEITEFMSRELPKVGGSFIQAESELASINMCYGAAAAGGRVLTSSSSPGVALMQEGLSGLANIQAPMVIINIMRAGPGIGAIQPAQADYFQATRGGGNGDYHIIVYAPDSIQEAMDMMIKAYDVADEYRNPVMILADGMLGQMMEPVTIPKAKAPIMGDDIGKAKPWALTGHKNKRERNAINSVWLDQYAFEDYSNELWKKYIIAEKELPEYEIYNLENADIVFCAYGTTARIVRESIDQLAHKGIKAGLIRPKTLWPFPYHAFDEIAHKAPFAKLVISAELSRGQLIQDVKLAVLGKLPVELIGRVAGILLTPDEITAEAEILYNKANGVVPCCCECGSGCGPGSGPACEPDSGCSPDCCVNDGPDTKTGKEVE